jgi:lipopolysaccharide export system permease protein
MPILFRYLLKEYAKNLLMCFAGLMTVYLVIDFFEKVRRFLSYGRPMGDVLSYFALKVLPFVQIIPLAVLMATLLTLAAPVAQQRDYRLAELRRQPAWIASPS